MYEMSEVPESHYGFLTDEPTGELLKEDVLVHQDTDLSGATIDELSSFIENSSMDAQASLDRLAVIQETIGVARTVSSVDFHHRVRRQLNQHQSARLALAGKYGFVQSRQVSESLIEGRAVLALESDEKDERGFFRKVIDKICDAFKWLWKKLTGLFSSGKDRSEKNAEKAEEETKKLKEIDPSKIKIEELDLDLRQIREAYGFLGKHVTVNDLVKHLGKVGDQVMTVELLGSTISETFEFFVSSLDTFHKESTEDDMDKLWKNVTSLIVKVYSKLASASKSEIEGVRDSSGEILEDGRKLDELSYGRTAYFWMEVRDDQRREWKSYISSKREVNQDVHFDLPLGDAAGPLGDMLHRVFERSQRARKGLKDLFEKNEKRTEKISTIFNNLLMSNDVDHTAIDNVRKLFALAQAMGRNMTNISATLSGVDQNIDQGLTSVTDFMHRVRVAVGKTQSA